MVTKKQTTYNNILNNSTQTTTLIIVATLILSIFIRLILAIQTSNSPWHTIDGDFISILSPDPALYGYYAKLLLNGLPHNQDVHLIEYIIYFLVKITPFTIDQILYFTPAFLSSLVIIPTILISRLYIHSNLTIFAIGITASIGFGYYSRTYLGYFDTDVLNTFFPLMALYSMLITIKHNNYRYIIISSISTFLYLYWYHSSEPLVYGMVGWFIVYGIVFHFKSSQIYKASIILALSIVPINLEYQIISIIIVYVTFHYVQIHYRYFLLLFFIAVIFALYKIDISQFQFHANRYLFKGDTFNSNGYNFLSPMQLVAEAVTIDYKNTVELISGNLIIFSFSILGYIFMVFKRKEFILALPLVVLGLLSFKAGVRFHIYAVSILIISFFFLFYYRLIHYRLKKIYLNSIIIILFLFVSFENYKSINYWNNEVAVPVFTPIQIKILEKLKSVSSPKDYIVTWWDYGWPIWYYTNMKTLIDNGKHHEDNYIVSKILLNDSPAQANHMIHLFYEAYNNPIGGSAFDTIQSQYKDIDTIFEKLKTEDLVKNKTSEKFIFIPFQMINKLFTIYIFSNIDIKTGEKLPQNMFIDASFVSEDNSNIKLSDNQVIDKVNGLFVRDNDKFYIKNIHKITYENNKKVIKTTKGHKTGLDIIIYKGLFYIMDERFFNSFFIQAYFFDRVDEKYFEKIIEHDQLKLYRVR